MSELSSLDQRATTLLQELSGPHGIHASLASTANYRAIFTRDAVMAGVAGCLLADQRVMTSFGRTLEQLRDYQGDEGQIASNYEVRPGQPHHVSFGTIAPRIDGATWYLVGVALAARAGVIQASHFEASVRATVRLLNALEYNGRHLVYVPTGGNWADEYIYEGYILYDQVLRAWALQLLAPLYQEPSWAAKSAAIAERISSAFFAADTSAPHHPIAAFTPVHRHDMFDLAACALLAVSGLLPERAGQALQWIDTNFLQRGALPPAFHPVIHEGDAAWPALRRYHLHAFRNQPHEYHNGGIWPIWLGWLALGCARTNHADFLGRLRERSAEALGTRGDFAFEEYLHGETGLALGTPGMAYTASGLVFLRLAGSPAAHSLLSA